MAASSRRIVGLGLCVVDHLYVVDRFALAETRTRYHPRRVCSGGMVGTALLQAARLGCPAELLSCVGDDDEGRFLERTLRRAGVGTRRLRRTSEHPTSVAVVLVKRRGGERRFLVPDRRELERTAPDFDLRSITRGGLLLIDGHFPGQALRAARRAREVGATVIGDFNHPRPHVRRLLPYVDYPVVPEEFLGDQPPRAVLRNLHERYGGTPVVTLGRRGGLYLEAGRVRRYRSHRVDVRDTTGAGDVFHGAFAAGLYHDLSLAGALDLASRAAAHSCTALGGTTRLLGRSALQSR